MSGSHSPERRGEAPTTNQDVPPGLAIAGLLAVVAALFGIGRGSAELDRIYFAHFEALYGFAFAVVAAAAAALLWFVIRQTRPLAARRDLLMPVVTPDGGIHAGRTTDGLELFVP